MRSLVKVPASSESVLYVFYDFETTHDTKRSDTTNEHVPNLVCLQQFCSKCEKIADIRQDLFSAANAYTRSRTTLWEIC